jgi:hypothetical protein
MCRTIRIHGIGAGLFRCRNVRSSDDDTFNLGSARRWCLLCKCVFYGSEKKSDGRDESNATQCEVGQPVHSPQAGSMAAIEYSSAVICNLIAIFVSNQQSRRSLSANYANDIYYPVIRGLQRCGRVSVSTDFWSTTVGRLSLNSVPS